MAGRMLGTGNGRAEVIERPLKRPAPMPSKNKGGKDAGHEQWAGRSRAEVIERPSPPVEVPTGSFPSSPFPLVLLAKHHDKKTDFI